MECLFPLELIHGLPNLWTEINRVDVEECLLVSQTKGCGINVYYARMAKITFRSSFIFSLVAPEYVLTAAHCIGLFDAFEIGALCNSMKTVVSFLKFETIAMQGAPIGHHPEYDDSTL